MVLALLGLIGGWGCLGGAGEVCTSLHRHTCQCPSSFQHAFSSRHCGCLWAASTGMMTLGLRDQLQDSRNAKKLNTIACFICCALSFRRYVCLLQHVQVYSIHGHVTNLYLHGQCAHTHKRQVPNVDSVGVLYVCTYVSNDLSIEQTINRSICLVMYTCLLAACQLQPLASPTT